MIRYAWAVALIVFAAGAERPAYAKTSIQKGVTLCRTAASELQPPPDSIRIDASQTRINNDILILPVRIRQAGAAARELTCTVDRASDVATLEGDVAAAPATPTPQPNTDDQAPALSPAASDPIDDPATQANTADPVAQPEAQGNAALSVNQAVPAEMHTVPEAGTQPAEQAAAGASSSDEIGGVLMVFGMFAALLVLGFFWIKSKMAPTEKCPKCRTKMEVTNFKRNPYSTFQKRRGGDLLLTYEAGRESFTYVCKTCSTRSARTRSYKKVIDRHLES
jgi:hypothetical protein